MPWFHDFQVLEILAITNIGKFLIAQSKNTLLFQVANPLIPIIILSLGNLVSLSYDTEWNVLFTLKEELVAAMGIITTKILTVPV